MKVSGFTIARNVIKYNYPILESIRSILPICDEFVVNVGDSQDATLDLIASINSPKIKIIENVWDFSEKSEVLSHQTNLALKECVGDWAFYLQSDEVVHQNDLKQLQKLMRKHLPTARVDALRFRWFHFFGSYYRYRIDQGWYQKQDRIIRNNGQIESFGDAYGFKRKDDKAMVRTNSGCSVYHYGWVQPEAIMTERRINAENIGFVTLDDQQRQETFDYGSLDRFPVYFGSHPSVMQEKISAHPLSVSDAQHINKKYWYHPLKYLKWRYKTSRRIKKSIV